MDRVLIDRQELERLKAMEKKLILEQKMKELTKVDYPIPPKNEPAVSQIQNNINEQIQTSEPLFFQSQNSDSINQNDEIENKIKQVFESQNQEQKNKIFIKKPFFKKNVPPLQVQEKFDKWLQESCKNNCFICIDCEKKLREIINEGWVWFQKSKE